MIDKNKAMIEFLSECPTIKDNPLFFNFAEIEDGNNHFITEKDVVKTRYIDGTTLKQYTFTIATYFYASHVAVDTASFSDANIDNMHKVQEILDWIDAKQNLDPTDPDKYPDFGPDCVIDTMSTLTSDPDIDGIDTSVNPPIARYSIGVKIEYLDNSTKTWK